MRNDVANYDPVEVINTPDRIAAYLEAAMEDGDPELLVHAIGIAARARGMARIAGETGLSRVSLYKALSQRGNPRLDTLAAVLKSLGLRLSVKPVAPSRARAAS